MSKKDKYTRESTKMKFIQLKITSGKYDFWKTCSLDGKVLFIAVNERNKD